MPFRCFCQILATFSDARGGVGKFPNVSDALCQICQSLEMFSSSTKSSSKKLSEIFYLKSLNQNAANCFRFYVEIASCSEFVFILWSVPCFKDEQLKLYYQEWQFAVELWSSRQVWMQGGQKVNWSTTSASSPYKAFMMKSGAAQNSLAH